MKNLYLVRTAMVASLGAILLGAGWIGMHGDEMRIVPETVAVSSPAEPAMYFPAGFELQANRHEPEVFEYY